MNTSRSAYTAHNAMQARANAQMIERAEWRRMLADRDTKREARRQARRSVPRNGAQWGAVSYVATVVLSVVSAVCALFGRFI